MKLFETSRLLVRQTEAPDFAFLHALYTRPEVMQFVSSGRFDWTMDEIKEKYAKNNIHYKDGYGLYIIELKEEGIPVGEAGIFNSFDDPAVLELGYILDTSFWRNGYGTELCHGLIAWCFRQLQARTVVARMYAQNTGSVQVSEKCGMKRTEEGITPDGKIYYRYEIEKGEMCSI